jgi:hypothetical protein
MRNGGREMITNLNDLLEEIKKLRNMSASIRMVAELLETVQQIIPAELVKKIQACISTNNIDGIITAIEEYIFNRHQKPEHSHKPPGP